MADVITKTVNESKARSALNSLQKASRLYEAWPFGSSEDLVQWLQKNVSPNFLDQFGAALNQSGLTSVEIDEQMVGAANIMEGHWSKLSWQFLYDVLVGRITDWSSFDFIKSSLSDSIKQAAQAGSSIVSSASMAARFYPWIIGVGSVLSAYFLLKNAGSSVSRGVSRVYSDASRRLRK